MIDSHCHLFFDSLKNDISNIIDRSNKKNINAILSINTRKEDFQAHHDLIKNYKSVFITYGLHPEYAIKKNMISVEEIVNNCNYYNKIIGIGETGIDLYYSSDYLKYQYEAFENHIVAAYLTSLPLIIHQ